MYIPDGFTTVTPYFFVENADGFGQFLQRAFAGVELGRSKRPDGLIANLQIRIGAATMMISEATPGYPAMPCAHYLFVEDCEAAMDRAVEAGAKVEMAVFDMPYGDRQGGVRDPFGNLWWISQRLVEEPYFKS